LRRWIVLDFEIRQQPLMETRTRRTQTIAIVVVPVRYYSTLLRDNKSATFAKMARTCIALGAPLLPLFRRTSSESALVFAKRHVKKVKNDKSSKLITKYERRLPSRELNLSHEVGMASVCERNIRQYTVDEPATRPAAIGTSSAPLGDQQDRVVVRQRSL
jgi:hypothetical protein